MPQINSQQGSALLTALFIMTLVAIVATAMSTKIQLDIYRTKLMDTQDKLYLASQAVTFWAMGELGNKKNKFYKAKKNGVLLYYPQNKMEHNSIPLSGALYDAQALFNLNNLANKKTILQFVALLAAVLPSSNEKEQIKLTLALNDWLSPYDLARGKDMYLSYYLAQKPPYYPSHQLMSSPSELRLVKDITAPIYRALEPFITALPGNAPINLNTAPIPVLKSLSNSMNEASLKKLLKARKEQGIKNLAAFAELLKKLNIANDQITLESTYFLSVAHGQLDHHEITVYTLLKRTPDEKGKLSVSIVREALYMEH